MISRMMIDRAAGRMFPRFFVDSKNPQRQLAAARILLAEYNQLTLLIMGLRKKIEPQELALAKLEHSKELEVSRLDLSKLESSSTDDLMNTIRTSWDRYSEAALKAREIRAGMEKLERQVDEIFSRKYEIRSLFCPQENPIKRLDPEIGSRIARLIGQGPGHNIFV